MLFNCSYFYTQKSILQAIFFLSLGRIWYLGPKVFDTAIKRSSDKLQMWFLLTNVIFEYFPQMTFLFDVHDTWVQRSFIQPSSALKIGNSCSQL